MESVKKTKYSLLVIDDEQDDVLYLTDILRGEYELHVASSPVEGVELAKEHSPDVIMLDIRQRTTEGVHIYSELRKLENAAQTPIILTGRDVVDFDREMGLQSEATFCLVKPFLPVAVKLSIKNCLTIIGLQKIIERMSHTDIITGLANRQSFDERLEVEWNRALRDLLPLSLMIVDIDGFKKYNEVFGHHQGDTALQAVSHMLKNTIKRTGDFVAHLGGGEFAVILTNSDSDDALMMAENVRMNTEAIVIPCSMGYDEEAAKITVSIGLSTWNHEKGLKLINFIQGARKALEAAKSEGQNRVRASINAAATEVSHKKTIFIVDADQEDLATAEEILGIAYRIISTTNSDKMFKALEKFKQPDLILVDAELPEINGFETLKQLRHNHFYTEIPVIITTRRNDPEDEARSINLGAVDFIAKPYAKEVVLSRIRHHLQVDEMIRERTIQLTERKNELLKRQQQLMMLQNGIVYTLADIVEKRDNSSGRNIDRMSEYMRILIEGMLVRGVYADEISDWNIESVISSARLHDIGKIAIPEAILNKPERLTDEEFDIIKTHVSQSTDIIRTLVQRTGDLEFLQNAELIAAHHHERWNGSGYPEGLEGAQIPLISRVVAVIDVYDALVSERPYKKALPHDEAVRIIMNDSGLCFDPEIVRVFCEVHERFKELLD